MKRSNTILMQKNRNLNDWDKIFKHRQHLICAAKPLELEGSFL